MLRPSPAGVGKPRRGGSPLSFPLRYRSRPHLLAPSAPPHFLLPPDAAQGGFGGLASRSTAALEFHGVGLRHNNNGGDNVVGGEPLHRIARMEG
ncbi:hypothetical protein E2562_015541 [Oryza meyeriana var. granulata]|uniref:Uncharacterized protein n=1 Tax=Oryza meyeriana var. granulata TaxID=110450 RepID=A0A6G1CQA6_9ORYZ|nr:hypothetical protein E2562_015541 [Oryza meyeriana var. granulata]